MSKSDLKPVVALCRIQSGAGKEAVTHQPGTMFVPANEKDDSDLRGLNAVRDLTEAEQNVYDAMQKGKSAPKPQSPGGRSGGRKTKAEKEAEEAAAIAAAAEGEGDGEGADADPDADGEGDGDADSDADADAEANIG
jgi:hypothetical protein